MRARPDSRLQELIGHVYEAAFDDARWSRLDIAIAAGFRAASASLDTAPLPADSHLLDSATGNGQVIAPFSVFTWEREQWERSRGGDCPDWCHRPDVCYVLGACFPIAAQELGQLHIHRLRDDGNFDTGDRGRMITLLPHLRRAMQLRKRIARAQLMEQASASALDSARLAAFVVDAELRLIHANPAAHALLDQGEVLRLAHGRLVALTSHNGPALLRLVHAAAEGASLHHRRPSHWLRLERGPGRPPLTLTVLPLPPDHEALAPQQRALILLRDPERVCASVRALQQLFDLTPAEAGVAQALSGGGSLDQVAQALLISLNTVKTHLHRIFDKTATSRQGELIALIHGSIATYAAPDTELKNNNVTHLNDAIEGVSGYTGNTEWHH